MLNIKIEPESNINTTMLFNSSQMQLIEDTPTPTRDSTSIKKRFFSQTFIVMFLLFTINLIKFMDRFTIAGILKEMQVYFRIDDTSSGLLQTVFICSYMLIAPLFGYLGDRYPRKWLIIFGLAFWSSMTFLGSFVRSDQFLLFLLLRGCVGLGEASFSCIATTIIGDLFTGKKRTQMLSIFCMGMPLGSGLGYIVSSNLSKIFNDWHWSLRFTPILSFFCIIIMIVFVNEPKRGAADNLNESNSINVSSLKSDIIYLLKNKTFMFTTASNTFVSFVMGGLAFWAPLYVIYAVESKNQQPEQIPLKFGVTTCVAGVFGVIISVLISPKLRKLIGSKADTLICAIGSLLAVPTLFTCILITRSSDLIYFWLYSFLAIISLSLSWPMMADIHIYTIQPNRRSSASAFNILFCHLFGDASSPFIIGAISDALKSGMDDSKLVRFNSLRIALLFGPVFAALSFVTFLFAVIFVEEDKKKVDDLIN